MTAIKVVGRRVTEPEKPRWCCAMPTLIVGPTRAPISSPRRRPMNSGQIASVPISPFGPCCSVEPMGMMMPFERWRYASTSSQVCRCSCMTGRLFLAGERRAASGRSDGAAADRAGGAGDGGLDLGLAGAVLQRLPHLGDELFVIGAVARGAGAEIEALRLRVHRLERESASKPGAGEQRRRPAASQDRRREEMAAGNHAIHGANPGSRSWRST